MFEQLVDKSVRLSPKIDPNFECQLIQRKEGFLSEANLSILPL